MQYANRREFLKTAGVVTLGVVASGAVASALSSCASPTATPTPAPTPAPTPTPTSTPIPATPMSFTPIALPWPYQKLDPNKVAERAYAAYYNGGCMFGAFEGIVGELRDRIGQPYTGFPTTMMKYGGGGVSGWGTLCGTLNGAAAAIYLTMDSKVANPIINEVFGWYGATALPTYKPVAPKYSNIGTSVADSQLCHVSISKWCTATGIKATAPERAERCAWLTASVALYTVNLMNNAADGAFKATFVVPASVTGCLSCHGKGGVKETVAVTNASDCTNCHTDLGSSHPGK